MAIIAIEFGNIAGECTISGCEDHVEAVGLRETIETGLGSASRSGRSRASDIELIRYRDAASPKLSQACAAAENLGASTIRLFQNTDMGPVAFMVYTLEDTYVSRIDQETLDEGNNAFLPSLINVSRGMPVPGNVGLATALAPVIGAAASTTRMVPTNTGSVLGAYTNREIERVYLNVNSVTWGYTPYVNGVASGVVERGFNLRTGTIV